MSTTRREFLVSVSAAVAAGMTQGGFHSTARAGEDRKFGVAVVGLGNFSTQTLIPAFQSSPRCRLAAIVSGSPGKSRFWSDRCQIDPRHCYDYDRFDKIAEEESIDLVVVTLPNSMHAEYTIRAALAGKHVLCEMPMAITSMDCRQMIDACRHANRLLAVGLHSLESWLPTLTGYENPQPMDRIDTFEARFSGTIEDPRSWRLNKSLAGGGALMGAGFRALHLGRRLFGEEPKTIVAQETKTDARKFSEVEESIAWTMHYASGRKAICSTSYNFNGPDCLTVTGERDARSAVPKTVLPASQACSDRLDEFAQCIQENRNPGFDGEQGLKDLLVIEAIYRSIQTQSLVQVSSS
jgi:predicted dehydrogenase